jgi:hypothetical protein
MEGCHNLQLYSSLELSSTVLCVILQNSLPLIIGIVMHVYYNTPHFIKEV